MGDVANLDEEKEENTMLHLLNSLSDNLEQSSHLQVPRVAS